MIVRDPVSGELLSVTFNEDGSVKNVYAAPLGHVNPAAKQHIQQQILRGLPDPSELQRHAPPAPMGVPETERPLSKAPPTNRGNGKIVRVSVNGVAGFQPKVETVFQSPQNKEDGEDMILTLGCNFQKVDPTDILDIAPFNLTAKISWGIGGANFAADVDWYNGVSFPVCASYVRVDCRIGDAFAPLSAYADVDLWLQASVGYGTSRNGSNAPTRTIQVGLVDFGASVGPIAVPPFATSFMLCSQGAVGGSTTAVPPNLRAIVKGGGGNFIGSQDDQTIYDWIDRTNLSNQSPMFPLPGNARTITLLNQGVGVADRQYNTKLIFNLSL